MLDLTTQLEKTAFNVHPDNIALVFDRQTTSDMPNVAVFDIYASSDDLVTVRCV